MERGVSVFDSDGYTLRYAELTDPYTGERLVFEQAVDPSGFRIELDHVVSLADVFVSGGHRWKRDGYAWMNIANDPGNLIATSKSTNAAKGSRNAAEWLPGPDFARRFVIQQILVKTRYHLSVTESERTTMLEILE